MLFAVTMEVHLPPDLNPDYRADLLAREKAYSHQFQRAGKWPHIWRVTGKFANLSVLASAATRNCTTSSGTCRSSPT